MLYLNVGSGVHPAPDPWTNIDMNHPEDWHVDVIASALDLPYADEVADRVNFGHTLEHLSYADDAPQALREAWRVLRWNGQLGVVGPAMDLAIETSAPAGIIEAIKQSVFADEDVTYNSDTPEGLGHLWTADSHNTLALVRSVFPNAMRVPCANLAREVGWPSTDSANWQVAIFATKVDACAVGVY